MLPFKGRDRRRVAADEAAQASWRPSPPVPLGIWGQEASRPSVWHRDPQRPSILRLSAPSPDPGYPGFQVKDAAWRVRPGKRSSRRELQGKIAPIFAADEPQGRLHHEEEGFPQRFPSSRRGFRSFTPFCTHTHRRWGSIGSRGVAADRDRREGRSCVILRCQPRGYEYG